MRAKWTRLWRDYRFPLIVAFGTLPATLLIFAHYGAPLLPWLWAWPLAYVLMDAISTRIPGKWRICYGIMEVALLVLSGWYSKTICGNWAVLIAPGMYCLLLLWGLVLSAEDRNDRIGVLWYVLCIGVHLFAQMLLYSAGITGNQAVEPVRFWINSSFFICAILALVTLNQANLKFSTSGRQNASRVMQRKNLLLVFALFAVGMILASIPALVSAAGELFRGLIIAILWLFYYILGGEKSSEEGSAEGQGSGGGEMGLPAGEVVETPQWLTVILTVIILALVAAVLGYCLYFLVKKLIVFVKYLTRISGKYLHAVSEDYVDEISDTREGRENTSGIRSRKVRLSSMDERKLPPDQRIRYRYLRLVQKHPEWDKGATARESVSEEAAPLYEQVRYSTHSVTEEDAQKFLAETKKQL